MKNAIVFVLLLALKSINAQDFSRLNSGSATTIDNLASTYMASGKDVGVAIGIIKDGEIVYLKAYGYADQELQIDATTNTLFRIGDMSKTITAVAALQLDESNDLDLTMDIKDASLLDNDWPAKTVSSSPVTITSEDLLSQESGLSNNSYRDRVTRNEYIYANRWSYDPIGAIGIFDTDPLAFVPGSQYRASQDGFVLLSAVIEAAGGAPYEEQVWDNIADIAEMPFLYPGFAGTMPYSNMANRYYINNGTATPIKGGDADEVDISNFLGGSGWMASARDMTHFMKSLMDNDLISSSTFNTMTTDHLSSDANYYGYGCVAEPSGSDKEIKEFSFLAGAYGIYRFLKTGKDGVVVLSNTTGQNSSVFWLSHYIMDEIDGLTVSGSAYSNPVPTSFSAPTLSTPSNSSTDLNTSVQLSWASVDYAGEYEVEYADNSSFTSSTTETVEVDTLWLSHLETSTTYYWRVRAINPFLYGGTNGTWSGSYSFTTKSTSDGVDVLPFTEDFENFHDQVFTDQDRLISGDGYTWSFENSTAAGRLKSGVWSQIGITGNGALSLDCFMTDDYEWNAGGIDNTNYLTLTLDLSIYSSATDLTLAFDYIQLGDEQHSEDKVWVRGSNTDSWLEIYDWWTNKASTGTLKQVSDLDIDALLTANSQTVSSTFQIRFGQRDNSFIYGTAGSDGLILDNIQVEGHKTVTFHGNNGPIWNNANNWSPGRIPTKDDNVVLTKAVYIQSGNAEAHDIISNSLIYLNGEYQYVKLELYGDFTGSGYIAEDLPDYGTELYIKGTTQQTIGALRFFNGSTTVVYVDNNEGVVLGNDWSITEDLMNITNGTIELGDYSITFDDYSTMGSTSNYFNLSGTGKINVENTNLSSVNSPTFHLYRNGYVPMTVETSGFSYADFEIGVTDHVYANPTTSAGQITTDVVDYTWTLQFGNSVDDVTVTVGWPSSTETSGFSRSQSMLGYWENGVSSDWNDQGTISSASGSDPYYQSRTIDFSTNLYYFGVGSSGSGLPVELTYFTAHWQAQGKTAQLTWQTAMEENNSHFEIERSFDGQTWEQIGRVEGAGNSISTKVYSYVDKSPSLAEGRVGMGQTIYYRLKQVDYNGAYEYSPVRSLKFEQATLNSFTVYPNPSSGNIIRFSEVSDYKLYDLNGILLKSEISTNSMDVSNLPLGSYVIKKNPGVSILFIRN